MRFNSNKYLIFDLIKNKTLFSETKVKCDCCYHNKRGLTYNNSIIESEFKKYIYDIDKDFNKLCEKIDNYNIFYFSKNVINNILITDKFTYFFTRNMHLLNSGVFLSIASDFQYIYQINNNGTDLEIIYIVISGNGLLSTGYYKLSNVNDINLLELKEFEKTLGYSFYHFSNILRLEVFRQLIEVDSIVLKPKEKRIINNQKTLNEIKNNINIIDINYFQTSINQDGFNVKGHFRFQPFGKDRLLNKLIWINDFSKKGYIRKAKIDSIVNLQNNFTINDTYKNTYITVEV